MVRLPASSPSPKGAKPLSCEANFTFLPFGLSVSWRNCTRAGPSSTTSPGRSWWRLMRLPFTKVPFEVWRSAIV
jgi:hypothetical protein